MPVTRSYMDLMSFSVVLQISHSLFQQHHQFMLTEQWLLLFFLPRLTVLPHVM